MKIQSSYIFLQNPFNKENNSDNKPTKTEPNVRNVIINVPKQVIQYLAETFPDIVDLTETPNAFFNQYSSKRSDNGKTFEITFSLYTISSATYLDISVQGERKAQIVSQLEIIQNGLLNSGIREQYIEIISYDSISEYYCNKLIPLLNETERNIRALLFNMFTLHFKNDYYKLAAEKCDDKKVYERVALSFLNGEKKQAIRDEYHASGKNEVETVARMQHFFESMEYNEFQKLLFSKSWTEQDEKQKERFLTQNKDLSALSDDELRHAFASLSPKSNWERFFSDKINNPNIKDTVNHIREYRNTVAHFKTLDRNNYLLYQKELSRFNDDLLKAIKLTKEEDFSKKYMSDISLSISRSFGRIISFFDENKDAIKAGINRMVSMFAYYLSLLSPDKDLLSEKESDILEAEDSNRKEESEQKPELEPEQNG